MEDTISFLIKFLEAFSPIFDQLGLLIGNIVNISYANKLAFTIFSIFFALLFRIAIANLLYVKRKDKRDWVLFGIVLVSFIVISFIKIPNIWFYSYLAIILFCVVYCVVKDSTRELKTTIYNNNIIYEDNSDKGSKNKEENAIDGLIKSNDIKIRRSFSFTRTHLKLYVPVFVSTFTFKISSMATNEQIAKAISYLNNFYDEYNWRQRKDKKGKKYEFSAELKVNSVRIIPFDLDISNDLDWYIVPVGAIDVSSKKNAHNTPYVWCMQDPKSEGRVYESLKKTKVYSKAPHCFICGSTGGGKSVLVNSIIAHYLNKAKTKKQVQLYLCDAKRVEFKPFECLEEVQQVAVTLQDAVDLLELFVKNAKQRNELMSKESFRKLPLDGKVHLDKLVDVNGHLLEGRSEIEYRCSDGNTYRGRVYDLLERDDVLEVNIPVEEKEKEEEEDNSFW